MNTTATTVSTPAPSPSRRRASRARARAAATIAATALLGGLATAPAASAAPGVPVLTAPGGARATVDSTNVVLDWYVSFLGRDREEAVADGGLGYWAARLDAGETKQAVLSDLVRTPEFARDAVEDVYLRLLGRDPDPGARYWSENIPRGMAVEWVEQNVLASDEYYVDGLLQSWVEDLYPTVLGRPASRGEADYWAGRVGGLGRLGVVRAIWYSPEAVGGRVADTYAELLGRSASPAEVDYWRAAEARSDLAVRVAIASSAEYSRPDGEGSGVFPTDQAGEVESFLDEVAAGRWQQAYDRLSDEARAGVGGYDGFYGRRGELGEELAAFAAVPRRGYLAAAVGDGSTAVVVAGDVVQEGRSSFATSSFGVRLDGNDDGLGIDVLLRPVGLTLAPADRTVDRGDEPVTLTVDRRGLDAYATILVDGEYTDLDLNDSPFEAGRTDTTFTLYLGEPGRAVVTALAQVDDGPLQVESAVFTVR